ncbi:MAG: DMP19 family protein [Anaerolineaceae bacterium]
MKFSFSRKLAVQLGGYPMKRLPLIVLIVLVTLACQFNPFVQKDPVEPETKMVPVHLKIDDAFIDNPGEYEAYEIIQPVWWTANIYEDEQTYNQSLAHFSNEQRYVFAIEWYIAEVNNGGHWQFYYNSTGIVWKDALAGLKEIGLDEAVKILEESARHMGGEPSLDRKTRWKQLDKYRTDFDDLDQRFYAMDDEVGVEKILYEYIRNNRGAFYFDGQVLQPDFLVTPVP